jgi:hypothetical protein
MLSGFIESDAEEAALGWLETLGYTVRHGPEIAYKSMAASAAIRDTTTPSYKTGCIVR